MEEKQPSYLCDPEEWGRYLASKLPRFRNGDFIPSTRTLEPFQLKDVSVTTKLEPFVSEAKEIPDEP